MSFARLATGSQTLSLELSQMYACSLTHTSASLIASQEAETSASDKRVCGFSLDRLRSIAATPLPPKEAAPSSACPAAKPASSILWTLGEPCALVAQLEAQAELMCSPQSDISGTFGGRYESDSEDFTVSFLSHTFLDASHIPRVQMSVYGSTPSTPGTVDIILSVPKTPSSAYIVGTPFARVCGGIDVEDLQARLEALEISLRVAELA